ncbi:ribonuclease E domain-containing protein [Helicobacter pylori]|uniref:hypothetical protein n=1 Tax=Helicobacter pylori TaxID=210 RepID=UPI0003FA1B7B|nr:hypothetical protein [Helicobacter pylori]
MTMIVFNQNPMIAKLLESVSKKLELPMENFNHYEELSVRLKKDPEWLLIADDESLEKLDQVDWLELKEIISQNHLNLCMYKKGNEAQPFLEGFEVKMKKPFLPTEVLKILQKKLGFNASEPESSQNLEPVKETLEANWDALEDLGDLESLAKEEPNAEEQLLPTLDAQKENEEIKEEEKQEVAETPQEKEVSQELENPQVQELETQEVTEQTEAQELETPKDETQENAETPQEKEVSKELETLQTQEAETQEIQEEKQEQEQVKEKSQDSPSAQELEAMQELVKEIQENSNEDKKENQEIAETPQETQETETQEIAEIPQEAETQEVTEQKENQEITETPQETETKTQDQETPPKNQETQENYETIEDIPEPVMAKAMGEALPLVNDALIETSNNENAAQTPKESVTKTPQENAKDSKKSDATSSPLELRLNLQDLLKSLNQESLKSLLENKTLSIKITLEDKNPHA